MNCESEVHIKNTLNLDTFKTTQYFGNLIHNPIHKNCPRGVPISYAKKKLVGYALKLQGKGCKSPGDREIYNKRHDKINALSIGSSFTVNQLREIGFHGQEIREDLLLAVCEGAMIVEEKENLKTKKKYFVFTRVEKHPACLNYQYEKLIVNGKRSRCELCQLIRTEFKNK